MDGSYDLLVKAFTQQIRELKALIVMRVPDSDRQWWGSELEEINDQVKEVERVLTNIKGHINYEKQFIADAAKLKAAVKQQGEEIYYIQSHLPARLPGGFANVKQQTEEFVLRNKENIPDNSTKQKDSNIPSSQTNPQQKPKRPRIETIPLITKDELESVPKYIKGRVTQDKINAAIEEIQAVVETKYKILASNYLKLSGETLKKYKAYKDEETPETKGIFFFSEAIDMKQMAHLKLDASGKATISILRALNRIRDLGGANRRYAIN